jgi:hypothetical protein
MTFHRQVLRQLRLRDVIENTLFDLFSAHGDGARSNAIGRSWFALARFVFEPVGQTDVVPQNNEFPMADNARDSVILRLAPSAVRVSLMNQKCKNEEKVGSREYFFCNPGEG